MLFLVPSSYLKWIKKAHPEINTWDTLSMGMSGDMKEAIANGSTMVRVGTAIFGAQSLNFYLSDNLIHSSH